MPLRIPRHARPRSRTRAHAPRLCLPALLLSALLGGCAYGPQANPRDPLEPFNRVVFQANSKLDEYVAQPVAKGYRAIAPTPVRVAVTNFCANLADVGNIVNNLLQGKGADAMDSLARVAINTLFGLGGLIDFATPAGVRRHAQDFGLTLGNWHVEPGPYLVLPLLGPSTLRDGAGQVVNFKLDPVTYARPALRNTLYGLNFINTRTNLLDATELLSEAALDPYSFVRDAYLQQRRYLIDNGKGPRALPNYDEPGDSKPPSAIEGGARDAAGRGGPGGREGPSGALGSADPAGQSDAQDVPAAPAAPAEDGGA